MELKEGEHIILDENGAIGFREKMTLTDKRLLIQKGEGFFRVKWNIEDEIPLEDISEVYADFGSFTSVPILKLRLKRGQSRDIRLKLSDSQMAGTLGDSNAILMRVKSITDRWVNAINYQIIRLREQNTKP